MGVNGFGPMYCRNKLVVSGVEAATCCLTYLVKQGTHEGDHINSKDIYAQKYAWANVKEFKNNG